MDDGPVVHAKVNLPGLLHATHWLWVFSMRLLTNDAALADDSLACHFDYLLTPSLANDDANI